MVTCSPISTLTILHLLVILYPLLITTTSLPPDFPPGVKLQDTAAAAGSGRPTTSGYQEDKMRLGSRPPSCHNKCNFCHPCMAVQAPSQATTTTVTKMTTAATQPHHHHQQTELWSLSAWNDNNNNRYSNYKPLGWKCRCRNRIYDP